MTAPPPRPPRVVVVGPCASGKSTLARGLRALGFDADVCSQEHSDIPSLWRHTAPDVVIALSVDLATIRTRRGEDWPEWLYRLQNDRLREAQTAARIRLDTSRLDAAATLSSAATQLRALLAPG
jgi:dephospho-CoA kinase